MSEDLDKLRIDFRKKLVEVLKLAFDKRDHLEVMIEDELYENLDDITYNEPDYGIAIRKLVKWAESTGYLLKLIVGAAWKKPGNPGLRKLVQDEFKVLCQLEFADLPSELVEQAGKNLFLSLVEALKPIVGIDNFEEVILPTCIQILPDIENSEYAEAVERLRYHELSSAIKWLILLNILLRSWIRNSKEQLHIVLFVHNLTPRIAGASQTALNNWLNALPRSLRIDPPITQQDSYADRPPEESLRTFAASLIITVKPLGTSEEKYFVSRYISTRLGNDDRYSRMESMTLQFPESEPSSSSSSSGPCYTLKEIQDAFPDWLVETNELILNKSVEIKRRYDLDLLPSSTITVEFWLPPEHINAAIEDWNIYGISYRKKQLTRVLGKEYRTLIRSYDRLEAEPFNRLNNKWNSIESIYKKVFSKTAQDPVVLNSGNPDYLISSKELQPQIRSIFSDQSTMLILCDKQYEKQQENLWDYVLEEGIPFILWARCPHLEDSQKAIIAKKLCELDADDISSSIDQLLEELKEARNSDDEVQLAFWCDEPKRLMELKEFSEKSGKNQGRMSVYG